MINETIEQINHDLAVLRKAVSYDDSCIQLFSKIVTSQSSLSPLNELALCLTHKLEHDLENQEYKEAICDIQGWLNVMQEKTPTYLGYAFLSIIQLIQKSSTSQLREHMKSSLVIFKEYQTEYYHLMLDYYAKYALWGSILPEENQYELFDLRSISLKEHLDDFILLYSLLEDYRSKYCLISILMNWLYFDYQDLEKVKEHAFADYFDLDLLQFDGSEVIVDLGAYTGDTLANYMNTYKISFAKYYCYDISKENLRIIEEMLQKNKIHNVVLREAAVGNINGELFFDPNMDPSANKLKDNGKIRVDAVTIDEDIKQPVSFIKMDIEGAEQDALLGCREHIRKDHPKLAVSVYHNNEDIWKISKMIRGMDPGYRFYLRYNGGNLVPTETILFAI